MHRNIISIVKPTRCTNVSNLFYFGMTLHVSDSLPVHHQESSTVHTAIGICRTGYAEYLNGICVMYWTPDGEQRNCPKHVQFYIPKIKLRN